MDGDGFCCDGDSDGCDSSGRMEGGDGDEISTRRGHNSANRFINGGIEGAAGTTADDNFGIPTSTFTFFFVWSLLEY